MECRRCGKQTDETNGYETIDGDWVHNGCSLLMANAPRAKPRISRDDFLQALKKVDAINEAEDRRLGRIR